MISVLAFDISQFHTGWAIGSNEWPMKPAWGTWRPGEWMDREGEVIHQFWTFLEEKHAAHSLTNLMFETMFFRFDKFQPSFTEAKLWLAGTILHFGHKHGIRVATFAPQSWRDRFLGFGKAPRSWPAKGRSDRWKKEAVKQCLERGWMVDDHNAAEALGLMDASLCALDPDYAVRTSPMFRRAQDRADRRRACA